MKAHPIRCPVCGRAFADSSAMWQHTKTKAGRDREHALAHAHNPHRGAPKQRLLPSAQEQSMADIAVDAEIKRLSGEPLDPLERSLLP